MFLKKHFITIMLLMSVLLTATEWLPGQLYIKLEEHVRNEILNEFIETYSQYELRKLDLYSPSLNIRHFAYNSELIDDLLFINLINDNERVITAEFVILEDFIDYEDGNTSTQNHSDSIDPKNPLFHEQWSLHNTGQKGDPGVDISMSPTWETLDQIPHGNSRNYVIAVIDRGFDFHPDINWYPGWCFADSTATILAYSSSSHGTRVSGVFAAIRDNYEGITGVSLNNKVKAMPLNIGSKTNDKNLRSNTLSALNYVKTQKLLFDNSNGNQGSNIIAVNISWVYIIKKPMDPDYTNDTLFKEFFFILKRLTSIMC